MKVKKSLVLATSSVLVIQNITEASTPPIPRLEDNPDSSPPQQNQSEKEIHSRISTQGISPESSAECEPLSGTADNSWNLKNGNTTVEPQSESPTSKRTIPCVSTAESLTFPPISPALSQHHESATPKTTESQGGISNSSQVAITTITTPTISQTRDTSARDLSSTPGKPNQSQENPPPIRLIQVAAPETVANCESSTQNQYNARNSTVTTAKTQSNIEESASQ
ncbi:MAG TPA: hypothetical protein V6C95_09430, partial [Coleofasciculaceae cyanobacterium]